jgi:hypothetical protein
MIEEKREGQPRKRPFAQFAERVKRHRFSQAALGFLEATAGTIWALTGIASTVYFESLESVPAIALGALLAIDGIQRMLPSLATRNTHK